MTVERVVVAALPEDESNLRLLRDINVAARRANKADPGDRSEIMRYEALSVELEQRAWHAAVADPTAAHEHTGDWDDIDSASFAHADTKPRVGADLLERLPDDLKRLATKWLDSGRIVVALRAPLAPGSTRRPNSTTEIPPPSERWEAPEGVTGLAAVRRRFKDQLTAAVGADGDDQSDGKAGINPSGVSPRVLTDMLRSFVVADSASSPVKVQVTYRDGSTARHRFPLRCIDMLNHENLCLDRYSVKLNVSLLSVRHTKMDAVTDGAWLRNAEVSRSRQAALTDDFVSERSSKQLQHLTGHGPLLIRMFQTGLEPAIVGFYRAVAQQLLDQPASLAVIPMFYTRSLRANDRTDDHFPRFALGDPWAATGSGG